MEPNKPKAYADMSLSELVIVYNAMANSPVGKSCELKAVQNFRDKNTAVRRCTGAEVMIRAATKTPDAIERLNGKVPADAKPKEKEKKTKSEFGVRSGTNREKLIQAMLREPPKTAYELSEALYGDPDKVGAMKMVMKGIIVAIEKGELPYTIVKEKDERGTTYVLKEKN